MKIPLLDLSLQYKSIRQEIDQAIGSLLERGSYIMGPQVKEFEDAMCAFLDVKHAIGVASGSDALLLSLDALGIGSGDKVIVPTFTFFATAGAVHRLGAIPVFVDIDPITYNMNLNQVEQYMHSDKDIKAIIPVHIFGLPVDMQHLMGLAQQYHIHVIEDACQAINADCHSLSGNYKAGTIGDAGCFSFFPSKNLGCYGDGGLIACNSDVLADKIRTLRVHGSSPKYYHSVVGYNSRLDTLQAVILLVKLRYLNEWTINRRRVASLYDNAFKAQGLEESVKWPEVVDNHVFHQYVIEVDHRDKLADYLHSKGVATSVYYPLPLHMQECFKQWGYFEGDLPIAEQACRRVLALPIDPELNKSQIDYIVSAIDEFMKGTTSND